MLLKYYAIGENTLLFYQRKKMDFFFFARTLISMSTPLLFLSPILNNNKHRTMQKEIPFQFSLK